MLHALEAIVFLVQQAHKDGNPINFPQVSFENQQDLFKSAQQHAGLQSILGIHIPLNVHPQRAHAIVVHKQARSRHIDPAQLSLDYYHHLCQNGQMPTWPVHTRLIHSSNQPADKTTQVYLHGPTDKLHGPFQAAVNLGRIKPEKLKSP